MKTHVALRHLMSGLIAAVAALIVGLAILTLLPSFAGFEVYAVTSSSMAPQIPPGSLAIVDARIPGNEVGAGDVVAFKKGEADESVCVHRVESIDQKGGLIQTKGDANDAPDLRLVPFEDVIGAVCTHVPCAGFVLIWMETHRLTFLGIAIALLLASASLTFALPRKIPSKKGRECPNRTYRSTKEA